MMHRYEPSKTLTPTSVIIVSSWLGAGIVFFINSVFNYGSPPSFLGGGPVEMLLGTLVIVGSCLALLSVLKWKRDSTAWQLELAAWPLLSSGWAIYSLFAGLSGPWLFQMMLGIGFHIASNYRFLEMLKLTKQSRKNVRAFEELIREG